MTNILVLNGSPKGDISITMQSMNYLERKYPQHSFEYLNIAARSRHLERSRDAFNEALARVEAADMVIWAFPLYYMLVHAGYKRFIEMIFERGGESAFAGKPTMAFSTSIHFYDHTAQNYIHAICDDLNMRYLGSYAADMHDLFHEEEQARLCTFFEMAVDKAVAGGPILKQFYPVPPLEYTFNAPDTPTPISTQGKTVAIIHDAEPGSSLAAMVAYLEAAIDGPVTTVDLNAMRIKGYCTGCCQCGGSNVCVYDGKDDHRELYEEIMQCHDILLYCGAITDRYLSARWKSVFDRSFFGGHAPMLHGKQIGFVISGRLSAHANLAQMLAAYPPMHEGNMVGFMSDEPADDQAVAAGLCDLIGQAVTCAQRAYTAPHDFLTVGGRKIFRDDVWGRLRMVFIADHRRYKELGFYNDFPQRDLRVRLLNAAVIPLMDLPGIREKYFEPQIKQGMIARLKKVVESA